MKTSGRSFASFGFRKPQNTNWVQLFIACLTALLTLALIGKLILPKTYTTVMDNLSHAQIILFVVLLAPICEEIFCRGLLISLCYPPNSIQTFLPSPIVLVSTYFAAIHFLIKSANISWALVFLTVALAFIVGIITGYYRLKTKSLLPCIVIHIIFNISGYIAYLLMPTA